MEPPSAPARPGRDPWQGLLLAVSLLTFWNPPTTAQLTLELVPSSAAEGKDVLFLVHNLPENRVGYAWYRGGTVDSNNQIASYVIASQVIIHGPAYSGRETIYHNGSLLFKNVNQQDTGYYIGQVIKTDLQNVITTAQLRVYPELPKPNITTNNSDPVEHKDPVVLTCEPETPNTTYLWLINSQSVPDSARLELSKDNRTLTLLRVTRNDIGPYECESRNPVSAGRSDPFYLNVLYGPEAPTISPSDTHYRPGANLSLSCHAASNPPAQYSWLINGRPKLSTQEIIIPNITANDSGSYTCLVHNSVTGLKSSTVRTITVSELVREPSLLASKTTVTEYKDLVFLTCLTNDTGISIRWVFSDQSLWLMERMNLSQDSSTLTIDPVRVGDAGDYQCEVSNPVSSNKSARITLDVIAEKNSTGRSRWTITGIVIGVLVGVVLAAILGCFLFLKSTRRASDRHDLREHRPPASTPGHGPSGTTTASPAPLPDPRAAVPIYQELLNPNTSIYCRIDGKADMAS